MKFKLVLSDMHFGNGRIESRKTYTKYFQGKVYLDGIVKGRVHLLKYTRGLTRYRYAIFQYKPNPAPRSVQKDDWALMEQGTESEPWIKIRREQKEGAPNAGTHDPDRPLTIE